jgi:hypothetical protein
MVPFICADASDPAESPRHEDEEEELEAQEELTSYPATTNDDRCTQVDFGFLLSFLTFWIMLVAVTIHRRTPSVTVTDFIECFHFMLICISGAVGIFLIVYGPPVPRVCGRAVHPFLCYCSSFIVAFVSYFFFVYLYPLYDPPFIFPFMIFPTIVFYLGVCVCLVISARHRPIVIFFAIVVGLTGTVLIVFANKFTATPPK